MIIISFLGTWMSSCGGRGMGDQQVRHCVTLCRTYPTSIQCEVFLHILHNIMYYAHPYLNQSIQHPPYHISICTACMFTHTSTVFHQPIHTSSFLVYTYKFVNAKQTKFGCLQHSRITLFERDGTGKHV